MQKTANYRNRKGCDTRPANLKHRGWWKQAVAKTKESPEAREMKRRYKSEDEVLRAIDMTHKKIRKLEEEATALDAEAEVLACKMRSHLSKQKELGDYVRESNYHHELSVDMSNLREHASCLRRAAFRLMAGRAMKLKQRLAEIRTPPLPGIGTEDVRVRL